MTEVFVNVNVEPTIFKWDVNICSMAKMPEPFGLQDFKNTREITHLAMLGVNISLTALWFF